MRHAHTSRRLATAALMSWSSCASPAQVGAAAACLLWQVGAAVDRFSASLPEASGLEKLTNAAAAAAAACLLWQVGAAVDRFSASLPEASGLEKLTNAAAAAAAACLLWQIVAIGASRPYCCCCSLSTLVTAY